MFENCLIVFTQQNVTPIVLKEGSETEIFWEALGGKKIHPSHQEPKEGSKDPHLFSCKFSKGSNSFSSFLFEQKPALDFYCFFSITISVSFLDLSSGPIPGQLQVYFSCILIHCIPVTQIIFELKMIKWNLSRLYLNR